MKAESGEAVGASTKTRRQFLRSLVAVSVGAVGVGSRSSAQQLLPLEQFGAVTRLTDHVLVFHGPVNVGIVRDGDRALLIDCSDSPLDRRLPRIGVRQVAQVVFTHHHRDQTCGVERWVERGARVAVPEAERSLFENPAQYWADDRNVWNVYRSFRPDHLTRTEPLPVQQTLRDGDQFTFGPARIRVLATPGHTDGSVTYIVESDGVRVAFCGDALAGPGQLWDFYSLQKGFTKGGRTIGAYHGFLGDRWRLVEGLRRVQQVRPDVLVPSHGRLSFQSAQAIDQLAQRLEECYENYVSISALRHYFPELFTEYAGRPGQMPIRPGFAPPDCLLHVATSWILVSKSGAAFVMDVGSRRVVDQLKRWLKEGRIKSVEGLWVTHYHSDHTAGIPAFQKEFDCPCYAEEHLAAVLTNPKAWRLPVLMPTPVRVDRPLRDGSSWQWHEFKLTAFYYPGQTLYHDALLVERDELRMLFVGDSHTMAGNDDYCTYNRNWLGRGVGFDYCLSLIERLQPTHLFNCHVNEAFTFTAEEIAFMRRTLQERERLFAQVLPWEHPNYGTDPWWVRCTPYWQAVRRGRTARFRVVVTNHSATEQLTACRAVLPKAFGGRPSPWRQTHVPAKAEREVELDVAVPPNVEPGRYVVTVDVRHGSRLLPQFAEALLDVT